MNFTLYQRVLEENVILTVQDLVMKQDWMQHYVNDPEKTK